MTDASREQKLLGTDEPVAPWRTLRAGPLSVELVGGNLRYVRFDGHEAIRAIAFVVRDENWGTHGADITGMTVGETGGGFSVSYQGRCHGDGGGPEGKQELVYDVTITATAPAKGSAGTLTFQSTMKPRTRFRTVRAGFVVLHPLVGVAGRDVDVLHTDDRTERVRFPSLIAAAQPCKDVRALCHQVVPGVQVTCRMEGDVFEVEDQRNWSDASFKTYSRPLALPYPYDLEAGVLVIQTVTLTFDAAGSPAMDGGATTEGRVATEATESVTVRLGAEDGVMPAIGIGVRPEDLDESERATDAVAALGVGFLLCHLDLSRGQGARELRRYAELARKSATAPALELVLAGDHSPADEIAALATLARQAEFDPIAVAVSPAAHLKGATLTAHGPPLDEIYRAARKAFPRARIGGGTFAFFAELNRKPPPTSELDFITHTTCATIHTADDVSVMETLECLPSIIGSARALAGRAAYRMGPIAIGTRDNPYGARPADNPEHRRVAMAAVDPRQRALFGAAFYLGYAAHAARGGVEALTLCAPTGAFGLCEGASGRVAPAYHVARALAGGGGTPRIAAESSDPRRLEAVAFRTRQGVQVLLANLSQRPVEVRLTGEALGAHDHCQSIAVDEHNVVNACADPDAFDRDGRKQNGGVLLLGPLGLARVRMPG